MKKLIVLLLVILVGCSAPAKKEYPLGTYECDVDGLVLTMEFEENSQRLVGGGETIEAKIEKLGEGRFKLYNEGDNVETIEEMVYNAEDDSITTPTNHICKIKK